MSGSVDRSRKENMKVICVLWTLLCVACMAVMLSFAANKTIVIADVSDDQSKLSASLEPQQSVVRERELNLQKKYGVNGSISVPLSKGIKAENVVMENRYLNRELWLHIKGGNSEFYAENAIAGDLSPVLSGQSEEQADGVLLKIRMNHVLEYRSTMDGNELTISWSKPHEQYGFVVVLDASGGGGEAGIVRHAVQEKELTLQVARQVQKKFAVENVKLYLTRTDDAQVSAEERVALAEDVEADFYIRLCVGEEENTEIYGISGRYNEEYFIPDFGNADLTDIVTREVTIASSNRAIGLEIADSESILRSLNMPAAEVSLGCLSNPKEAYLLKQDVYREKLADGVVNAISKAVEAMVIAKE